MKNLTIILALVAFSFMARAQNIDDRNSGKYYANPKIGNFTGSWVSNEEGKEIELVITTKKTHRKTVSVDYYRDAIFIQINKYRNNGEDFAKKLTEPFMLVGDPTRYTAFWIDPITKNEISIQLDSQDENNLSMKVRTILPTKTGTFFHRDIKLTRKK